MSLKHMGAGVDYYAKGVVPIRVYYPNQDVCCGNCLCCIKDPTNIHRNICMATREIIVNEAMCGHNCPMILDKEVEDEEVSNVK